MPDVSVFGGLTLDMRGEFDDFPDEGGEVFTPAIFSGIGGVSYNIARTLSYLGESSKIIAYVGEDLLSALLTQGLKKRGIDAYLIRKEGVGTATVFSVITPYDRTMFTYRGADSFFSFTDDMADIARDSKITCISSYVFMGEDKTDNLRIFLDRIKNKTRIVFSMAIGVLDTKLSRIIDVLDKFDIIFANESEYDIIGKYIPPEKEIVVTMGEKGARYIKGNDVIFIPQKDRIEKGRFTGAGDVFCAGFLSGLLRGFSPKDSLILANQTALSWISYKFG